MSELEDIIRSVNERMSSIIRSFSNIPVGITTDQAVDHVKTVCKENVGIPLEEVTFLPPDKVRSYFEEKPDLWDGLHHFVLFENGAYCYWVARVDGHEKNLGVFRVPKLPEGIDSTVYQAQLKTIASLSGPLLGHAKLFEQLQQEARYDGLTRLMRKEHIISRGEAEYTRATSTQSPLALLVVDLDHFKKVNDTYGHSVGDEVLRRSSEVLRSTLRTKDVPGRYGGEEFVVILPDTPLEGALVVAERIRQGMESSRVNVSEGVECGVTCSIGVAAYPLQSSADYQGLFKQADDAVYRAKEFGRNRVVYLER